MAEADGPGQDGAQPARCPCASALRALADRLGDWFPFGKAPAIILVLTALAAAWLAAHPVEKTQADLRFWTFADTHYFAYLKALPSFEAKHPGKRVDIQFVHWTAVTSRLRAAFWTDLDVPDMVEVEISQAGSFFRGPAEEVGFVDLRPRLEAEGLLDRMVKTRFAPYTYHDRRTGEDHLYGLPHDVHPVMLAYRRDLFEAEGVDVASLETWDDFVRLGRRLTIPDKRYMLDFADTGGGGFEVALYQRDGGLFDAAGECTMDSPVALETLLWYVPLVAGPDRIADDPGWGQSWVKAIEDGYLLTWTCPDWRSKSAEQQIPRMAGKMALMPLPAVRPGGRRTSSWGGTMLGITRKSRHPDLAWALAKHFYLNPDELAERFRETNILPALKDAWKHAAINEPRPYWSGQPIGTLYARLAEDVPAQYTSPYIDFAKSKMSEVVAACSSYYDKHGADGFEAFARERLKAGADEVRNVMRRNPF